MMRLAGKNGANNLRQVVPRSSTSLSSSAYSQAVRRFSSRRGMATSNDKPSAAAGSGSGKPSTVTAAPQQKSSFPIFKVGATVALGSLALLAVQVDEENVLAERIVEEVPYLDHALRPFHYVIDQLREYELIKPRPAAPPSRARSPSPPPAMKEQLEVDDFNDVQAHVHIDAVPEEEEQRVEEKEEDLSAVLQAEEVSVAREESLEELQALREADDEASAVVQIAQDAQHEPPAVSVHEQERVHEERAEVAETKHHEEEHVATAAAPAGVLPRVVAEDTMQRVHGGGSVGEVLGTVAKNSIALRHELEAVLLKDIHDLDAPALRIRITQLAAELFERLSWESIRLSHSVRQVENELTEKYETLMAKQRQELELEVKKLLFERECELNAKADAKAEEITKKFQEELNATIKAQAEGFQATLQQQLEDQAKKIHTELQDQLNHQVALVRKSHSDALLALQPKVESLQTDLQKFDAVFESTKDAVQHTLKSHAISSAVLALEMTLSQSHYGAKDKVSQKLSKLRELCKEDELVVNLLGALPARVKTDGALSLSELQVRFQVMREEVRKAALAPEAAPKLVGQLVGTVLAAISIAPQGYVSGQGTEEILSRAAYCLERGKVKEALKELDAVSGYPKVLMKDWQEYAKERLVVDQALRTLKADSIIRHRSFHA